MLPDILVNHDGLVAGVQDTSGPAGGTFTYRAKVKHNTGPDATGVQLVETLPAGAIYLSHSSEPSGINCPAAPSSGTVLDNTNNEITCNIGNLGAGDGFKWVDFHVVLPTVASNWTATATASLSGDPDDGDGGTNNTDLERNFTANAATDFGIELSSNAPQGGVNNGDNYTYTIQVTNYGPSDLESGGFAEVTFQVPSGAPVTGSGAIGGTDWTCVPANGPVDANEFIYCTYPQSAMTTGSYGNGEPLPPITVPVQSQMGGPIGAAVSVQGWHSDTQEAPDGQEDNNTDSLIVQSTGDDYTDVSLTKSVSPQLVDAASGASTPVTYTLQVRREDGGLQPEQIVVIDTLPAGVAWIGFAASNDSRWGCAHDSGDITCSWDSGAAYEGGNNTNLPPIRFTANVPAQDAGNTITNSGHVTVKPGTEPNNANNSDSATVTFNNTAQLSLDKTGPSAPVKKGVPFQYTLTVKNEGPMPIAANAPITLTDTPSANLRLVSVDGTASSANWTCPSPLPGTAGTAVTCENSSALAVGETLTLVLNAQVDNFGGGEYVVFANDATVGTVPGRDGETASSNANVTVSNAQADLEVNKEVISAPGNPKSGDEITYRISVTNKAGSTQTAQAIEIKDVLQNLVREDDAPGYPGGGFVSAAVHSAPTGTDVDCPAPTGGVNSRNRTLTCTVDYLAVGKTVAVDVTIRPRITTASPGATTAMTYRNTASAFSPVIHDPTPDDNTASADIQLTSLVDLRVDKQVSPADEVAAGEPATYTVTVINDGPSSAQNVKMVDTLPDNAILVGEPEVAAGAGGSCTHDGGDPMNGQQGGIMTCEWTDPLAAHSQYVVKYKARSLGGDPAPGETMDNSVVVSTDTEEIDLTNNEAEASIALKPAELDVQIQMSHSDDGLVLGETTEYTITVKNDAASASYATNVKMTDLFPAAGSTATFSYQGGLAVIGSGAGVSAGYVSGVAGGAVDASMCTEPAMDATTGPLECIIPLMAPGDSVDIKFTMRAESLPNGAKTGTIFHAASVMPEETEYMPAYDALANNDTTDRTSTSADAHDVDLGVEKLGPEGVPVAGETVIYTITVTNYGQDATSPEGTMTDTLPAGLEFVSVSSDTTGASCSGTVGSSDPVECVVPEMAKGESIVYTIETTVSDPFTGRYPLVNRAEVSAPGDENPDNDRDEVRNGEPPTIPTLSEWSLILLSLMLALMTLMLWRQQVGRLPRG